jgi:hypothetical protein
MKTKPIITAILALAASFGATAQNSADDKSVAAAEAAYAKSMQVFELRRQLGLDDGRS